MYRNSRGAVKLPNGGMLTYGVGPNGGSDWLGYQSVLVTEDMVGRTIAVFVASSLIHMVLKYHNTDMRRLPDEEAARRALGSLQLAPGDYAMPYCGSAKEMSSPEYLAKRSEGLGRAVALGGGEAVPRTDAAEPGHDPVAHHLGHDARGRDRQAGRVAVDHPALLARHPGHGVVAVHEHALLR